MGMLFNTDATILLLRTLNERYNLNNLPTHKAGDLSNYNNGAMTLYQIWQSFHASSLNTGNSPNGEANFSQLLNDYHSNDNGTGRSTADAIRSNIVSYLQDSDCVAIEFFAIPSHQIVAHPTFHLPHHPAGVNKFSGIVAIETVTIDKAAAFLRSNRVIRG